MSLMTKAFNPPKMFIALVLALGIAAYGWFGSAAAPGIAVGAGGPRAAIGYLNVRDYGAIGNGGLDDTAAIDRAIDALPGAGIIYFPPGLYRISHLDPRNKSVIFQGAGWSNHIDGLPGAKSWSEQSTMTGSRLLCTAKHGSAISFPLDYRLSYGLRDLCLVGNAVPGVTGLQIDYSTDVKNVGVFNFDRGVATGEQACCLQVDSLAIRGCNIGLAMKQTNCCTFTNLKVSFCKTNALHMVYCVGNTFLSCAFQGDPCPIQIVLTDDGNAGQPGNPGFPGNPGHGCRNNRFINLWSEAGSQYHGKAWLVDVGHSSYDNHFDGLNLHSGDADQIHVAGPNNHFGPIDLLPWGGGDATVESTATGTVVIGPVALHGPGAASVGRK